MLHEHGHTIMDATRMTHGEYIKIGMTRVQHRCQTRLLLRLAPLWQQPIKDSSNGDRHAGEVPTR